MTKCGRCHRDISQPLPCVGKGDGCRGWVCRLCCEKADMQGMCDPCWSDLGTVRKRLLTLARFLRGRSRVDE